MNDKEKLGDSNVSSLGKTRTKRNRDLVKRMRSGEPLGSFNTEDSWFPSRPVLQKDKKVIDKLYRVDCNRHLSIVLSETSVVNWHTFILWM